MGHYILKDGGYIQYGPKVIPNPNAGGGGGGSIMLYLKGDNTLSASYNQLKTYYDEGIPVFLHEEITSEGMTYYKTFFLFCIGTDGEDEYTADFASYEQFEQYVEIRSFIANNPDIDMPLD